MGRQDYKTDDGRDAIAAGIAWLLHTHENLERVTNVLAGLSKEIPAWKLNAYISSEELTSPCRIDATSGVLAFAPYSAATFTNVYAATPAFIRS